MLTKTVPVETTILFCAGAVVGTAQSLDRIQRESVRAMARHMAEAVRKYYYDPAYHGIDVSSRFKAADERIQKAPNLGQAFGAIAEAVDALNGLVPNFETIDRPIAGLQ